MAKLFLFIHIYLMKTTYFKNIISLVLAISFSSSSVDLSLASEIWVEKGSTLAPCSRFRPIAQIKDSGDGRISVDEARQEPEFRDQAFEVAGLVELRNTISRALAINLSSIGLNDQIKKNALPYFRSLDFDPEQIRIDGGSVYVPINDPKTNEKNTFRYFKPDPALADRDRAGRFSVTGDGIVVEKVPLPAVRASTSGTPKSAASLSALMSKYAPLVPKDINLKRLPPEQREEVLKDTKNACEIMIRTYGLDAKEAIRYAQDVGESILDFVYRAMYMDTLFINRTEVVDEMSDEVRMLDFIGDSGFLQAVFSYLDKCDTDPQAGSFVRSLARLYAYRNYCFFMNKAKAPAKIPSYSPDKTLLDLASGPNFFISARTLDPASKFMLVDNSVFVEEALKQSAKLYGFYNTTVLKADIRELQFAAGTIGAVRAKGIWNYVPDLSEEWWERVASWIEDGGQLFVQDDPKNRRYETAEQVIQLLHKKLVVEKGWAEERTEGRANRDYNKTTLDTVIFTKPPAGRPAPTGPAPADIGEQDTFPARQSVAGQRDDTAPNVISEEGREKDGNGPKKIIVVQASAKERMALGFINMIAGFIATIYSYYRFYPNFSILCCVPLASSLYVFSLYWFISSLIVNSNAAVNKNVSLLVETSAEQRKMVGAATFLFGTLIYTGYRIFFYSDFSDLYPNLLIIISPLYLLSLYSFISSLMLGKALLNDESPKTPLSAEDAREEHFREERARIMAIMDRYDLPANRLQFYGDRNIILSLSGCDMNEISFIEGIHNLYSLDISNMPLFDISPLAGIETLRYLSVRNSRNITDKTTLIKLLRNLFFLNLSGTQIAITDEEVRAALRNNPRKRISIIHMDGKNVRYALNSEDALVKEDLTGESRQSSSGTPQPITLPGVRAAVKKSAKELLQVSRDLATLFDLKSDSKKERRIINEQILTDGEKLLRWLGEFNGMEFSEEFIAHARVVLEKRGEGVTDIAALRREVSANIVNTVNFLREGNDSAADSSLVAAVRRVNLIRSAAEYIDAASGSRLFAEKVKVSRKRKENRTVVHVRRARYEKVGGEFVKRTGISEYDSVKQASSGFSAEADDLLGEYQWLTGSKYKDFKVKGVLELLNSFQRQILDAQSALPQEARRRFAQPPLGEEAKQDMVNSIHELLLMLERVKSDQKEFARICLSGIKTDLESNRTNRAFVWIGFGRDHFALRAQELEGMVRNINSGRRAGLNREVFRMNGNIICGPRRTAGVEGALRNLAAGQNGDSLLNASRCIQGILNEAMIYEPEYEFLLDSLYWVKDAIATGNDENKLDIARKILEGTRDFARDTNIVYEFKNEFRAEYEKMCMEARPAGMTGDLFFRMFRDYGNKYRLIRESRRLWWLRLYQVIYVPLNMRIKRQDGWQTMPNPAFQAITCLVEMERRRDLGLVLMFLEAPSRRVKFAGIANQIRRLRDGGKSSMAALAHDDRLKILEALSSDIFFDPRSKTSLYEAYVPERHSFKKRVVREASRYMACSLPQEEIFKTALAVKEKILEHPYIHREETKVILCYLSFDDEVMTWRHPDSPAYPHQTGGSLLIESLLRMGKRVAVPVPYYDGTMALCEVTLDDLEFDNFGRTILNVWAPKKMRLIHKKDIDAAIIPGRAFDLAGHRIGEGGGYFDRLSQSYKDEGLAMPYTIGVSYDFQLSLQELPAGGSDILINEVITPRGHSKGLVELRDKFYNDTEEITLEDRIAYAKWLLKSLSISSKNAGEAYDVCSVGLKRVNELRQARIYDSSYLDTKERELTVLLERAHLMFSSAAGEKGDGPKTATRNSASGKDTNEVSPNGPSRLEDGGWKIVNEIVPGRLGPDKKPRFLTDDEAVLLIQEVRNGNDAAKQALVDAYQSLVIGRARFYAYVNPELGLDVDDLIQIGTMGYTDRVGGLMGAIDTYDSGKGASFKTYSQSCVDNSLTNYLKKERKAKTISLDEPAGDGEDRDPLGDYIEDISARFEDGSLSKIEMADFKRNLVPAMDALHISSRNQSIILERLHGNKEEDIAGRHKIYRTRVSQIIRREAGKLKGLFPGIDVKGLLGIKDSPSTRRQTKNRIPGEGSEPRGSASGENSAEKEKQQAIMLADTIKICADDLRREAKDEGREENRSIIIGIEVNGWVSDEQKDDIQSLSCAVNRFVETLKRRGIVTNVKVALGNSKTLLDNINAKRAELNDPAPHIAVLGSEKTLGSEQFKSLNGAFLAFIDLQNLDNLDYIKLLEMLNIMLNMSFGKTITASPGLIIENITRTIIRFKPVTPIDINESERIYKLQERELERQA